MTMAQNSMPSGCEAPPTFYAPSALPPRSIQGPSHDSPNKLSTTQAQTQLSILGLSFILAEATSYFWIATFNASLLLNLTKLVRIYHFAPSLSSEELGSAICNRMLRSHATVSRQFVSTHEGAPARPPLAHLGQRHSAGIEAAVALESETRVRACGQAAPPLNLVGALGRPPNWLYHVGFHAWSMLRLVASSPGVEDTARISSNSEALTTLSLSRAWQALWSSGRRPEAPAALVQATCWNHQGTEVHSRPPSTGRLCLAGSPCTSWPLHRAQQGSLQLQGFLQIDYLNTCTFGGGSLVHADWSSGQPVG